jgi:CrcB protein
MLKLIALLAGGALGTVLRYTVSGLTYRIFVGVFPWGTLVVNLIGSFLIGCLWGLFEIKAVSPQARTFIFLGLLGGFTTFSTYTLETLNLFREGETKLALLNIAASNILGLALVIAGFAVSKLILSAVR